MLHCTPLKAMAGFTEAKPAIHENNRCIGLRDASHIRDLEPVVRSPRIRNKPDPYGVSRHVHSLTGKRQTREGAACDVHAVGVHHVQQVAALNRSRNVERQR